MSECSDTAERPNGLDRPLEDQPTDRIVERLRAADQISSTDSSVAMVRWVTQYVLKKNTQIFQDKPTIEVQNIVREVSEHFVYCFSVDLENRYRDEPAFYFSKFLSLLDQLVDHSQYSDYEKLGGRSHGLSTFWRELKEERSQKEEQTESEDKPELPDDVHPFDPVLRRDDVEIVDLMEVRSLPARVEKQIASLYKKSNYGTREKSVIQALFRVPWEKTGDVSVPSIQSVKTSLDDDVYGMESAKSALLDELALFEVASKPSPKPLCLDGPPGIGKTHLVRTLSNTIDRPFHCISMAGVSDARKLRGVYPGWKSARPGRIARVFQDAGHMNPIVLLDEIDKVSSGTSGNSGDPMSFLIDLLDPDQTTIEDDFLQVKIDVSNAWFIATANDTQRLARPLRDRLNILSLSGYDADEQQAMLDDYVIRDVIDEYDLSRSDFGEHDLLSEDGRAELIEQTRNTPGVRNLKRSIQILIKRRLRNRVDSDDTPEPFGADDIHRILNPSETIGTVGF